MFHLVFCYKLQISSAGIISYLIILLALRLSHSNALPGHIPTSQHRKVTHPDTSFPLGQAFVNDLISFSPSFSQT